MSARRRSLAACSLLAAMICGMGCFGEAAATEATFVPTRGAPIPAALVDIRADLALTLETSDGRRTQAADSFVRWGEPHAARRGPLVLLADGGLLVSDVVAVDDERLLLASNLWGEVSLPIELARGIVFWPPPDPLQRDRLLDRLRRADGQSDRVLLENGDVIDGTLLGLSNDTVRMEVAAQRSEIPIERVTALAFDPSLAAAPAVAEQHAVLGFRDGTLLTANEVVAGEGRMTVRLPGDVRLASAADVDPLAELALLMSCGPHVTYVSDLEPLDYKHIPYLRLPWDYGRDRNVLGGRLTAAGRPYIKGLGMHSTSRLAYVLDRPYRRFNAELAIDGAARDGGSVVFRVLCDQLEGGWREAYRSPIVRGGDPPRPIDVDVTGAKRLVLIVEFADRADQLDHADWLGARLIADQASPPGSP